MRKSLSLIGGVAVLGALALMPAGAGAGSVGAGANSKVVPGGVYKGVFVDADAMEYKFRIKVFESGRNGNFSLRCAGVQRDKFSIRNDVMHIVVGADETMVKGKAEFRNRGVVKGEIKKIITPGHTCDAPGKVKGVVADV